MRLKVFNNNKLDMVYDGKTLLLNHNHHVLVLTLRF